MLTRQVLGTIVLHLSLAGTLFAQLGLDGEHRLSLTELGWSYTTADNMGASITTGDFDGDGIVDAAIGLPGRDIAGQSNAGAVVVVYGTPSGLGQTGARAALLLTQTDTGDDTSEADDAFGFALAAADFDGSGQDDLVVGAPFEDFPRSSRGGTWTDGGVVHVFWGSATGLDVADSTRITPDDYPCTADLGDGLDFGHALAGRDRDGDPNEDLVIGMPGSIRPAQPGTSFGLIDDAGAVFMLSGKRHHRPDRRQLLATDRRGLRRQPVRQRSGTRRYQRRRRRQRDRCGSAIR